MMIRRVALIRRKAGMTVEEFWAHYAGRHADIVRQMPGLRRLALSRPVGPQAAAWDAVGELWFDSREALDRAFADPAIAAQLQADRPLFLGASETLVVEEVTGWTPDDA
jgi:uncharacterized protein (TIGR02118 family)